MLTFLKTIPKAIWITAAVIFVLSLVAVYQWGYINGKQSNA